VVQKSRRSSLCFDPASSRPGRNCAPLSDRLAAFKTPRKIIFLAEIPKGAKGKLQRVGLAQSSGWRDRKRS
jgi:acyl-CoA synthetase (AMP-forming)/AMP-acid ligase II